MLRENRVSTDFSETAIRGAFYCLRGRAEVAREAHNLEVTGSNPVPATRYDGPQAAQGGVARRLPSGAAASRALARARELGLGLPVDL